MSEITTNKLNELLAKKADQELQAYLDDMLEEALYVSNQMQAKQDIRVWEFTITKGTYIKSVLEAIKKAMFAALCETNREDYINAWLKKANSVLEESKHSNGGCK